MSYTQAAVLSLRCDVRDCGNEAEFRSADAGKCFRRSREAGWTTYNSQQLAKCPRCKDAGLQIRRTP